MLKPENYNIVKSKGQTRVIHNVKEYIYPRVNMSRLTVASKPIFKSSGWELNKEKNKANIEFVSKPKDMTNETRSDSMLRAKRKVFDIVLLNDFKYFVTWTLSPLLIERTNPKEVMKKLKTFLNNMRARNNLSYVLIPEHHKDGEGIHIHALVNGKFNLVDSGKRTTDNKIIYHMLDWKFGFSTCIEITGDIENTAKYITKYISKDMHKIFGKFYYAGGNIKRKPDEKLYDVDYDTVEAKEYYAEPINTSFKYITVKGVT